MRARGAALIPFVAILLFLPLSAVRAAGLLLFPFEGRPDWANSFYNHLKAALTREGLDVVDFAPESPLMLRALLQKGLSGEEIAEAKVNPAKRAAVAGKLGLDGAIWGEVQRKALRVFAADAKTGRTRKAEFALLGEPTAFFPWLARQVAERIKPMFVQAGKEKAEGEGLSGAERKRRASALIGEAEEEIRAGNPKRAIELLYQALGLDSSSVRARLLLSEAYEKMGRLEDALAMARMAALISPKDPEIQHRVAKLAMRAGNWEEAERAFSAALLLKPDDPAILKDLADFYMRRGRPKEAAEALRKVCKQLPRDVGVKWALVRALSASGQEGEAISVLREIASLKPDDPKPHVMIAVLLAKEGKHEEALSELASVKAKVVPLSFDQYVELLKSLDAELVGVLEGVRRAIGEVERGEITREECFEVVSELLRRSERLVQLDERLEVPKEFKEARAHRKLAHALALQAMGDFLIYVDTNDLVAYHRAVVERDEAIKERQRAYELEREAASKRGG